jgi:hypothetical protein
VDYIPNLIGAAGIGQLREPGAAAVSRVLFFQEFYLSTDRKPVGPSLPFREVSGCG